MALRYDDFLAAKCRDWIGCGMAVDDLPGPLFLFQDRLTRWALRKGRAALWADTGLGKTRMQVAWASCIPGRVLIVAPLCVGPQTIAEAARIGVEVVPHGQGGRIEITNYERLHHVTPTDYMGVVLDESSILKSMDGKTRTRLIQMWRETPYRLCCTATPAPNDIAELANHCEFLGIMTRGEMLATFFVHIEGVEGRSIWRLKGHAHEAFYHWLATWGMFLRRPSDLGFADDGYVLPPLTIHECVVGNGGPHGGYLFPGMGLGGIRGRMDARRRSLKDRVDAACRLLAQPGQWIAWCGLNEEQELLAAAIGAEAVSVAGADDAEVKTARLQRFVEGRARILLTKPRIAGFGLNLQGCHQMAFVGLGDSYEQYYQAIRRCWRFGQSEVVDAWVIVSPAETAVVTNVRRKEHEAAAMASELIGHMGQIEREEIGVTERQRAVIEHRSESGEMWTLHQGDAVDVLAELPAASVDLSIYSPPFITLYTYTNSERDIGNCSTRAEFLDHFGYVVRELRRVTKPGRLSCCHIAQVASTKVAHGVIGLIDLRGAVIECFAANGWIYHGEVCIDKDPQAQAIRTKSKALLFVQLRKDASWLRPALADYVLVFRAPGENAAPIHPDITNEDWIEWARPIWYGIRESNTLNVREARGNDDDRHICPLQLGVIERCIRLWSNPGETVLSPFAGIGSEGYEAIRLGRRFVGIELKSEYAAAAIKNLTRAEITATAQGGLF